MSITENYLAFIIQYLVQSSLYVQTFIRVYVFVHIEQHVYISIYEHAESFGSLFRPVYISSLSALHVVTMNDYKYIHRA